MSPGAATTGDLLASYAERARSVGIRVERVPDVRAAAGFVGSLAIELSAPSVLVARELADAAPKLVEALTAAGVRWEAPSDPAATRDAPLGLSLGHLAVAKTGGVLLAEPTLEDRAIGLLAVAQAVVCPTEALVPSLAEAAPALRTVATRPGGGYATLVTGPSRTADIERVLTVGVQGPAKVIVLFVDDLS